MGLSTLHDMITGGAQKAGDASFLAAQQQQKFLEDQWRQLQGMQNPFIQQGQQAFGLYNQFAGGMGAEAQQQALSNFRMTPQAQYGLQQNLGNLNQSAAMTGGLFGGNKKQFGQAANSNPNASTDQYGNEIYLDPYTGEPIK